MKKDNYVSKEDYDHLKAQYEILEKEYSRLSLRLQSILNNDDKTMKTIFNKNISLERSNKRFKTILKQSDIQGRNLLEGNYDKEEILVEQAKMVALGELLENISHQWRQPLSIISTAATGMLLQKELNKLSDESIEATCNTIYDNVEYLSKVIDNFNEFVKSEKKLKSFFIEDEICQAVNVIKGTLQNKSIIFEDKIDYREKTLIHTVSGKIPQVLLSILNNSKDIILQREIKEGWITLDLLKEKNCIMIIIEDNGGGISYNVLPHIFEPYYTTKFKSRGRGLSLYLSYKIITESLNGDIYFESTKSGTRFYVKIPNNVEKSQCNP